MSINIKICGLCEEENILEVAELKPDLMGFIFFPGSPRYIAGKISPETTAKIPSAIRKAGVFVNADFVQITRSARKYSLDIVQLHGEETPETCGRLRETGLIVIKAFNISQPADFKKCSEYIPFTNYFLFDALTQNYGGSGAKFDWKMLDNYELDHPFFLSGGISPLDVNSVLEISNPDLYGIDLNSKFEIKPGLKDIELLKNFMIDIKLNNNSI